MHAKCPSVHSFHSVMHISGFYADTRRVRKTISRVHTMWLRWNDATWISPHHGMG